MEKEIGNTKPYTGGELMTVVNALGVDEYFGREMLLWMETNSILNQNTLLILFVLV